MRATYLFSREFPSNCKFTSIMVVALSFLMTACGSNSPRVSPPTFSGNTNLTVLLTSTANSQLTEFGLNFNSISLTKKSGETVTLVSNPQAGQWAEFIHLNGVMEPLATVSIPQGIYTSATANIGYSAFTCVAVIPATDPNDPGGLLTATFAYGYTPSSHVTVSMSSPITVTGSSLGLVFNMDVVQSASLASCYSPPGSLANYSITPTFNVMPVRSVPETGLNGTISSVGTPANSISVTLGDGQPVTLSTNSSTVYQGISGLPALTPGMLIIADAGFQSDGTHVAQRIAVPDTNTSTITNLIGPVVRTNPFTPTGIGPSGFVFGPQSQGFLDTPGTMDEFGFDLSPADFQISGALPNLNTLPFVPSFNNSNFVPGQSVYLTTQATVLMGPGYPPATTATLVPQVINGMVNSVATSGAFQVYTVTLAPYDLFPALAVQPGQVALLNNPNVVEVYVDGNTQRLNAQALSPGSTLRFYGLVFNDNGTLRMDCSGVLDGVTATLPTSSPFGSTSGQARTTSHNPGGHLQQRTMISNP